MLTTYELFINTAKLKTQHLPLCFLLLNYVINKKSKVKREMY